MIITLTKFGINLSELDVVVSGDSRAKEGTINYSKPCMSRRWCSIILGLSAALED